MKRDSHRWKWILVSPALLVLILALSRLAAGARGIGGRRRSGHDHSPVLAEVLQATSAMAPTSRAHIPAQLTTYSASIAP